MLKKLFCASPVALVFSDTVVSVGFFCFYFFFPCYYVILVAVTEMVSWYKLLS